MITLTPAYNRDYKNKKDVINDFNKDLDFILNDFTSQFDLKPINKSDIIEFLGSSKVKIRYSNLTKLIVIDVK